MGQPTKGTKPQAPTVFIVDDDEAVRNSLRLLVRSVGLPGSTAHSAQEFLESYDPATQDAWFWMSACRA